MPTTINLHSIDPDTMDKLKVLSVATHKNYRQLFEEMVLDRFKREVNKENAIGGQNDNKVRDRRK